MKKLKTRWFGIDRAAKQRGLENDIFEIGYKYQMTDLSASLGIALSDLDSLINHRRKLLNEYANKIKSKVKVLKL